MTRGQTTQCDYSRFEVSPLKTAKICKICGEFVLKNIRFALNAMNAVKKILSGEFFFTASAVKKSFPPLPAE